MGSFASTLNCSLLRPKIALEPCPQNSRDRLTDVLQGLLDSVSLTHAAREVQALDDITSIHLVFDH